MSWAASSPLRFAASVELGFCPRCGVTGGCSRRLSCLGETEGGGERGIDWFDDRGTLGYLSPEMGVSAIGESWFSASSGGVGSSGSVLSKEVSETTDSRTGFGGKLGCVIVMAAKFERSGFLSGMVGEWFVGVRLSLLV